MENKVIKDFRVSKELGHGGMATVYLVEHQMLHMKYAMKALNSELVRNENIRKRFLAEARTMARMAHPNIIKVTDLIDDGDMVAFVMEYFEGETLKDYLERKGKLTDMEIKSLFTQMLDAVGYVHQQNLVHRDIKPSNFMIDRNGKIKLLDFGIAKNTDASSAEYTQTGTGAQMGTPMYMSPEQITETKSVTAQSDIYSLGVVLWQMVTGQKPYDTKTLSNFQLQSKIVNELLLPTKTTWDAVISKATAKEVQARYSSASEFSKALHSDNIATDNQDATVVGGGKYETVVQKGHDKTVVDDAPKQKKDISLNERFEQERERNRNDNSKGKTGVKWPVIVGVLILVSALGYQFFIAGSGSSKAASSKEEKTFREVKIGNQVWMAENLNVSTFRNGETIPESKNYDEWEDMGAQNKPSWCYHDFDSSNGQKFGKLYNWYAVNDPRGLAPIGYHIPSEAEWTNLTNFLGADRAGEKLKSTSGWYDGGNGSNESGFTGLPGGDCDLIDISTPIGNMGFWWSATQSDFNAAMSLTLRFDHQSVQKNYSFKESGLSVRCIKD